MKEKLYEVTFVQTESFTTEVFAKDIKQAHKRAQLAWSNEDYNEMGDCSVSIEVKLKKPEKCYGQHIEGGISYCNKCKKYEEKKS